MPQAPCASTTFCASRTARSPQTRRRPGCETGPSEEGVLGKHATCGMRNHKCLGCVREVSKAHISMPYSCTKSVRSMLFHISCRTIGCGWMLTARSECKKSLRHLAAKIACIVTTNTSACIVIEGVLCGKRWALSGRGTAQVIASAMCGSR